MPISVNLAPSDLQADGAYVFEQIQSGNAALGLQTNTLALVGAANWGAPNVPQIFGDANQAGPVLGNTNVALSSSDKDYGLIARALMAMPECTSFIGVRVTDGTDVAATITFNDSTTGHVFTLTGKYTGSYGNGITAKLELVSGTPSSNPVYRLTITPPSANAEVYQFAGSSSGAYSAAVFSANLLAAVNGSPSTPASNWVIASIPGTQSVSAPNEATLQLTGGTDGASGLTDALIVGTDGLANRTGLYALRGAVKSATVALVNVTDPTQFEALDAFCKSGEACISLFAFPINTSTTAAISSRATNTLKSQFVMLLEDWTQFKDPIAGARFIDPVGAAGGIIASTPPYLYVGNKPRNGKVGVLATESTISQPIGVGSPEAAARESNGINWVGNPIPRGGVFGLYHGMMSDGQTLISDVRMANYIALNIEQILGIFVGEMQTTDVNDDTRRDARAAVNAFMNSLLRPTRQINTYDDILDLSNNTPTSIQAGVMLCNLNVETLSAVRFAIAAINVGNTVAVTVTPAAA